jgi:Zn finger protein HypA/HybF involved in hydrogenase expression
MTVRSFAQTLDQELAALARGASLECLVCGEFVMHRGGEIECPECEARIAGAAEPGLQLSLQAG